LIGEKWDNKRAQRGMASQMKIMGYPNFGFVSNSNAKLEFSRLSRSEKPVLGLVFSPGLRNGDWHFVHVLVVLLLAQKIATEPVRYESLYHSIYDFMISFF
jgi:hypothetical protein